MIDIIKIRCYGESFKIHQLKLDQKYKEQFYNVAEKLKLPIEEALLDIRFFDCLKIKKYKSIYDLVDHSFGGLIHNFKSKIEIKNGRKRLQQISMGDLTTQQTLFPLFNVEVGHLKFNHNDGLFLLEQEVGMISEYVIENNSINLDDLKFFINDVKFQDVSYSLLSDIHYKGNPLKSIKSDSLITYRYCQYHRLEKNQSNSTI